ncbi:MAG: hypothetical protein K0M69_17220 [Youngiibacter sp.]|nr:hypothetical protein [Youngiibacter sp.]
MIIREMNLEDVFLLSEVIDKVGLQADIDRLTGKVKMNKLESLDDAKEIGKTAVVGIMVDLINKLVSGLHKAKSQVMQLISNLTGQNLDTVAKMNIRQIKEFFTELTSQEQFKDFFK